MTGQHQETDTEDQTQKIEVANQAQNIVQIRVLIIAVNLTIVMNTTVAAVKKEEIEVQAETDSQETTHPTNLGIDQDGHRNHVEKNQHNDGITIKLILTTCLTICNSISTNIQNRATKNRHRSNSFNRLRQLR